MQWLFRIIIQVLTGFLGAAASALPSQSICRYGTGYPSPKRSAFRLLPLYLIGVMQYSQIGKEQVPASPLYCECDIGIPMIATQMYITMCYLGNFSSSQKTLYVKLLHPIKACYQCSDRQGSFLSALDPLSRHICQSTKSLTRNLFD